jgi:uncharacterized protein (TIGR03084 family)
VTPPPQADVDALIDDLRAEQWSLLDGTSGLGRDAWVTPVAAHGWDVRDTVAHLADTNELALDTMNDGPRSLNVFAGRLASAEDVTFWGVQRGRRLTGDQVREWFATTSAAECARLAELEPAVRVPWGLGMGVPAFTTARLMETWAHGLDVRVALGLPTAPSNRLRHVAFLGYRALPYAATVAGEELLGLVRVELTSPDGLDVWELGPPDAADRITGPAEDFCRVFVQRLDPADSALVAEGDAAEQALRIARAYL